MSQPMKMVNGKLLPLTAAEQAAKPRHDAQARRAVVEWAARQARARAELAATDYWVIKATETGTPARADRLAYRAALRAIAAAESGDASQPFPARPA